MTFDVNETLLANSLPDDLLPHLLWNELLAGVERRRVFLQAVQTTDMLRGAVGTKISVPYLSTRFTAGTISEAVLDSSGYVPTDPAVSDVDIQISDQVYVSFRISDILKEDQPKYDWIRILLRDAGRALGIYEDSAIRDVLFAAALGSNMVCAATAGTLVYADVIHCLSEMKTDSWYPEEVTPFLFVHPRQEADLMTDTGFLLSHRYAISDAGQIAAADDMGRSEVQDTYARLNVKVTENMTLGLALVVFPTHPRWGPVCIHAYKRPLMIRTDREELYGRQLWIASTRYGTSVIQANGVGLISNC